MQEWVDAVVRVLGGVLAPMGFGYVGCVVESDGAEVRWERGLQLVKATANVASREAPAYYVLTLGVMAAGDAGQWRGVASWRMRRLVEGDGAGGEYAWPSGVDMEASLARAASDLMRYCKGFLDGDLGEFEVAYAAQLEEMRRINDSLC